MKRLAPIVFVWALKLTVFMLVAVLSLLAWHDLLTAPWLSYPDLPLAIVNGKVKPGQVLQVVVSRCNASEEAKSYTISRELRRIKNDEVIPIPPRTTELAPGCFRDVIRLTQVPPGTPPGAYVMQGYSLIEGRLFPRAVRWNTEFFEVVK